MIAYYPSFADRRFLRRLPRGHRAIWIVLAALVMLTGPFRTAEAQPPPAPETDTIENWYDTLEVTKPRYAYQTNYDRLMLTAFTALSVPIAMVVSVPTIIPPSASLLIEGNRTYGGIAVSTGLGYGGDTLQLMYFPNVRVQAEAAYYFERERALMARASIHLDRRFGSIHPNDFYWLGVAGGAGLSTDFNTVSPFAEGWLGMMNPLGIRYLGLFPMHNFGVRARAGYDFAADRPWYELSISATSTFGK